MSDDTRPFPAPSRSNTLNSTDWNGQEVRKRKRDSLDHDDTSGWFDAKVISSKHAVQSISFSPISTVLRAHIPLAWLAAHSATPTLPAVTVFEAAIPSVPQWEYHILIARQVPNGSVHAIERIEKNIYVCHALQPWVTQTLVQQAAVGAAPPVTTAHVLPDEAGCRQQLRKSSGVNVLGSPQLPTAPSSPKHAVNRRGILARRSILDKDKDVPSQSLEDRPDEDVHQQFEQTVNSLEESQLGDFDNEGSALTPTLAREESASGIHHPDLRAAAEAQNMASSAQDARTTSEQVDIDYLSGDYLRKRYFETLYMSKTSLAFYAKGPLSRTRARLRAASPTHTTQQIADHYRDIILPPKKMDLKYKESLRQKVISFLGQDGMSSATAPRSRKKKSKLGKDAIWPMEEEFIHQWWYKRDYKQREMETSESYTAELDYALSRLRMRETELQIILILEVMAIELGSHNSEAVNIDRATSVHDQGPAPTVDATTASEPAGLKKKRNLEAELDNLLDRLCIWHSINSDINGMSSEARLASDGAPSVTARDGLRDFCKEVMVPFYFGKLPSQCKLVCQKLGGLDFLAQRSKPHPTTRPIPGSIVAKRSLNPRRTLSSEFGGELAAREHSQPATLTRSATVPLEPVIKREASERPSSRRSMHKALSFSNREIDLVADAKATAAKRRKMDDAAAQKRELEAAIAVLKKPNRLAAVRSLTSESENIILDVKSGRKRIEPVQISATPRHDRVRPAMDDEHDLPAMPLAITRSVESMAPSSTAKPRGHGLLPSAAHGSSTKRAVLSALHDTPSRPRTRDSGLLQVERTSLSTIQSTPSCSRVVKSFKETVTTTPLPLKGSQRSGSQSTGFTDMGSTFRDLPEIPCAAGLAMERVMRKGLDISIYESLGWDDDDL